MTVGLSPDVFSYNTVISAYAGAKRAEEAATWLDRMRRMGVMPDVVSYNTVISAYTGARQ